MKKRIIDRLNKKAQKLGMPPLDWELLGRHFLIFVIIPVLVILGLIQNWSDIKDATIIYHSRARLLFEIHENREVLEKERAEWRREKEKLERDREEASENENAARRREGATQERLRTAEKELLTAEKNFSKSKLEMEKENNRLSELVGKTSKQKDECASKLTIADQKLADAKRQVLSLQQDLDVAKAQESKAAKCQSDLVEVNKANQDLQERNSYYKATISAMCEKSGIPVPAEYQQ